MVNPSNRDQGELISRARTLYRQLRTPENSAEIRELVQKALADPAGLQPRELAATLSLLAEILMCDYLNSWNQAGADELAQAEAAVGRAFEIAPDLAAAHYASGLIHRARAQHEASLADFTRTVELNPEFALAHAQQGAQLIYTGRPLEALPRIETAIRISRADNPSHAMFYWYMGRAYFVSGNYRDAIPWLRRSVEGRGNLWYNRLYLVSACALQGDLGAASAGLDDFDRHFPNYTIRRVVSNEQVSLYDHPVMIASCERFHDGLRLAGMPG
jgi:adenylate cyclase